MIIFETYLQVSPHNSTGEVCRARAGLVSLHYARWFEYAAACVHGRHQPAAENYVVMSVKKSSILPCRRFVLRLHLHRAAERQSDSRARPRALVIIIPPRSTNGRKMLKDMEKWGVILLLLPRAHVDPRALGEFSNIWGETRRFFFSRAT